MTEKEIKRMEQLERAPYALTKPERKRLAALHAKYLEELKRPLTADEQKLVDDILA